MHVVYGDVEEKISVANMNEKISLKYVNIERKQGGK